MPLRAVLDACQGVRQFRDVSRRAARSGQSGEPRHFRKTVQLGRSAFRASRVERNAVNAFRLRKVSVGSAQAQTQIANPINRERGGWEGGNRSTGERVFKLMRCTTAARGGEGAKLAKRFSTLGPGVIFSDREARSTTDNGYRWQKYHSPPWDPPHLDTWEDGIPGVPRRDGTRKSRRFRGCNSPTSLRKSRRGICT